ncbi:MAG TPA: DUF2489 domain-containing protein [Marinospirillum sp.]|uniref:DUF2489 domain-containing protein n=1 Tax=Marinospirillum sp. TaxID=2183934 RepID=UPI002B46E39F|nr:DUF2489 domain-containing protein [Marinospirillum sp.]HKM15506.1 DUF2489 domain-containing protein [Marinospirillum sp.]
MSAQDATIFLAAAIALIIPLAGYAAHLHYEAKRQVALAQQTHEQERLKARENVLENLFLLAKALEEQQVSLTEGCLRVRVFLDLLDEGIYVQRADLVVFDTFYQQTKNLATHKEYTNLSSTEKVEQDKTRLALEEQYRAELQKAATQLRLFSEQQGKFTGEPLFVNAAAVNTADGK